MVEALTPQWEQFNLRNGNYNSYAVRQRAEHESCVRTNERLVALWLEAAARIEELENEN